MIGRKMLSSNSPKERQINTPLSSPLLRLPTEVLVQILTSCHDPTHLLQSCKAFKALAELPRVIVRFLERVPLLPVRGVLKAVHELRWLRSPTPSRALAVCQELRARCRSDIWYYYDVQPHNLQAAKYVLDRCQDTEEFRNAEKFEELAWFTYDNLQNGFDGTGNSAHAVGSTRRRRCVEVTSRVAEDPVFLRQMAEVILFPVMPSSMCATAPKQIRRRRSLLTLYGTAVVEKRADRCFALSQHWWPNEVTTPANAVEMGVLRLLKGAKGSSSGPVDLPKLQELLDVDDKEEALSILSGSSQPDKVDIYRDLYPDRLFSQFASTRDEYDISNYFADNDKYDLWVVQHCPASSYPVRDIMEFVDTAMKMEETLDAEIGKIFMSSIERWIERGTTAVDEFAYDSDGSSIDLSEGNISDRDIRTLVRNICTVCPGVAPRQPKARRGKKNQRDSRPQSSSKKSKSN